MQNQYNFGILKHSDLHFSNTPILSFAAEISMILKHKKIYLGFRVRLTYRYKKPKKLHTAATHIYMLVFYWVKIFCLKSSGFAGAELLKL